MRAVAVFKRYSEKIPFFRELMSGFSFALLARGLGYVNTILLVKLALPYLGGDLFGDLVAAMAFGLCFPLFDLGFGHSMINRFGSDQDAEEDRAALLSSAVAGSGLIALVLLALLPLALLLSANTNAIHAPHWVIVYVTFTLSMPFAVITKAQYGARQYHVLFGFNALHQLVAMVGLVVGSRYHVRSEWILAFQVIPSLLTSVASAVVFCITSMTPLRWSKVSRRDMQRCLRWGVAPFAAQFAAMVIFAAPTILIATLSSREEASTYYVLNRVFAPMVIVTTLLTQPMWSMFAAFKRRYDRQGRNRLLRFAIVAVVGMNALYFLGAWLLRRTLLAKLGLASEQLPSILLVSMATLTVLMCVRNPLAMALHGSGADRLLSLTFVSSLVYPLVLLPLRLLPTSPHQIVFGFAVVELILVSVCALKLPDTIRSPT